MSAWYKTGTITVTNGSTTVTGSGTQFISNVAIGEALYAPDGRLYEITNVASDTAFTISPAYLGSTQAGQNYTIVPSQSYIRDLAAQAADLVNNYSTIANFAGQGKFGDGTLTEPGIRFSDDLDTGFYRSGTNEVTFVAGGVAQFKYNTSGLQFTGNLASPVVTGDLSIADKIVHTGDTNTAIRFPEADTVTVETSGLERVRVSGSTLQINGGQPTLLLNDSIDPTGAYSINVFNGDLNFDAGSTGTANRKMVITSTGNVGIGTSSPGGYGLNVDANGIPGASFGAFVRGVTAGLEIGVHTANSQSDLVFNSNAVIGSQNSLVFCAETGGYWAWRTGATSHRTGTAGSTERMRIDSSGNVGIGTSSPSALAHISDSEITAYDGSATDGQLSVGATLFISQTGLNNNALAQLVFQPRDAQPYNRIVSSGGSAPFMTFVTNNAERMRITSTGNVGIGTSSPSEKLEVNGNIKTASASRIYSEEGSRGSFQISQPNSISGVEERPVTFGNNLYLDGDPNDWVQPVTGIGGTAMIMTAENSDYGQFEFWAANDRDVSTDIRQHMRIAASGAVLMPFVYSDTVTGRDLYIASNGQLGYVSSVRNSKTNIEALPSVDWLYDLEPVKFQYRKKDEDDNYTDEADEEIQYGMIAEDVEAINPDLVFYDETENGKELRGVQYSRLFAPLIQALKDQKAEIENLKAEIALLKGQS